MSKMIQQTTASQELAHEPASSQCQQMLPAAERRQVFTGAMEKLPASGSKSLSFARPGKERQDSMFNGFQVGPHPWADAAWRRMSPCQQALLLSCHVRGSRLRAWKLTYYACLVCNRRSRTAPL